MTALLAMGLGALAALGVFAALVGSQRRMVVPKQSRLGRLRGRVKYVDVTGSAKDFTLAAVLTTAGGAVAWIFTGWPVAALIGATSGAVGPLMWKAPRKRRAITEEIDAYSQWTEQVRDLVRASGSLYEAVVLSAKQAPEQLRPKVLQLSAYARTMGLPPALDWFAQEMKSPFADRIVLGMKIAWESGARVGESFDTTARNMREMADMRRRNEVGNARIWTQVTAIIVVTFVCVGAMFAFNAGFFDPFGSLIGQMVLFGAGGLIFGNVFWVLKLSESGLPVRLLASGEKASARKAPSDGRAAAEAPAPSAEQPPAPQPGGQPHARRGADA